MHARMGRNLPHNIRFVPFRNLGIRDPGITKQKLGLLVGTIGLPPPFTWAQKSAWANTQLMGTTVKHVWQFT